MTVRALSRFCLSWLLPGVLVVILVVVIVVAAVVVVGAEILYSKKGLLHSDTSMGSHSFTHRDIRALSKALVSRLLGTLRPLAKRRCEARVSAG